MLEDTDRTTAQIYERVKDLEGVDSVFVLGGASPKGDLELRRATVTVLLEKRDHSLLNKIVNDVIGGTAGHRPIPAEACSQMAASFLRPRSKRKSLPASGIFRTSGSSSSTTAVSESCPSTCSRTTRRIWTRPLQFSKPSCAAIHSWPMSALTAPCPVQSCRSVRVTSRCRALALPPRKSRKSSVSPQSAISTRR